MARRKHYSQKSGRPYASRQPEQAAVQAKPALTAAAQAVMAEAARLDQEAEHHSRQGGFEMKPRAVRRFEKYANMGD